MNKLLLKQIFHQLRNREISIETAMQMTGKLLTEHNLTTCENCGEKVRMIILDEVCPKCKC